MYLGLLAAFFNYLHLIFVLYVMATLHLQILQEEKFLTETFGEKYADYQKHTGRYIKKFPTAQLEIFFIKGRPFSRSKFLPYLQRHNLNQLFQFRPVHGSHALSRKPG